MWHSRLGPVNPCNDIHIVNATEGRAVALQAEDAGLRLGTVSPMEALRLPEWRRSVNVNLKNGGLVRCYV